MLASRLIMADPLRISLRYRGKDVDGGTMLIDDVVDALEGFSGAYGSVASQVSPNASHQLRLTGIDTHSFELVVLAAMFLSQHADQIGTLGTVIDVSKRVIAIIRDVITLKKHVKNHPYEITINGNNNTVLVMNADNSEVAVPVASFEMFKEKLIDGSLSKITQPLDGERVKAVELRGDDDPEPVSISSDEKEYFRNESTTTTTIKDADVQGSFISLNKERNVGRFRLKNGKLIPYRFTGSDPVRFHAEFGWPGLVVVTAAAEFNENLEPLRLDVISVKPIQPRLPIGNGGVEKQ